MITGVTFDFQEVNAKNDGRLYQALFGSDYILNGCECAATNSGAAISIAEGYVVVGGRIIHFDGGETKAITPTLTTGYGRLLIDIDLTSSASATEFNQATLVEQYSTTTTFPGLTQNDINLSGTHYQVELCRFPISASAAGTVTVSMAEFNVARKSGAIVPFANDTYDVGKSSARFKAGYFKNINVNGNISIPNPAIVTASAITNVNVTSNSIFKIPGATVYKFYGQFSSSSDGIPSNGFVVESIPSAYRPTAAFEIWCFAQTNSGSVLRATATIRTDGRVSIATQGSTSFRYFRIDAIIPQGL